MQPMQQMIGKLKSSYDAEHGVGTAPTAAATAAPSMPAQDLLAQSQQRSLQQMGASSFNPTTGVPNQQPVNALKRLYQMRF